MKKLNHLIYASLILLTTTYACKKDLLDDLEPHYVAQTDSAWSVEPDTSEYVSEEPNKVTVDIAGMFARYDSIFSGYEVSDTADYVTRTVDTAKASVVPVKTSAPVSVATATLDTLLEQSLDTLKSFPDTLVIPYTSQTSTEKYAPR